MTALRILTPTLLAIALVSCAKDPAYDTPKPYAAADNTAAAPAAAPGNPIYDTPAAYEETSATAPVTNPATTQPATPAAPAGNGAAIIHTVVKGDTLSGIAAKYKISAAAIKQANHMTNDTVVLDRKMVIPPR